MNRDTDCRDIKISESEGKNSRLLRMLRHGPVGTTLLKLSAPSIAGMLVLAIYNVADTFFVSLLRDTTAIAATGIVFPIFQLTGAVGLTFGMGAASVISIRLGEGKYEEADQAASTAFFTAVVAGAMVSIGGMIGIRPLLTLFGATDSIIREATQYGRIIIGGGFFLVLSMVLNNLLRSEGAALYSSMGQILGAVLNIILDPIFIFALGMGITGAAVATVISKAVAVLFLAGYYARGRGSIQPFSLHNVRLRWSTYSGIMRLGFPTFVRQVLGSVSFGILNNAAGVFGDAAIAAISVTLRIFMLLFMAMTGLAQGLQPLAGYNYGAGRIARVRKVMRISFTTAVLAGAAAGIAGGIWAGEIMHVFAPQDPEVVAMGVISIRMMSVALIPVMLVIMFGGVFQATGDGRAALALAAGQQGAFLIPMVLLLPRIFGLKGVFAALPSGFVLAFFIGLVLLKRTYIALDRIERKAALQEE